ncbi:MAG: hypothetical protein PXX83_03465 [Candidatus Nitrosotalea sp.]|nr:hypothetical protein [Candidatus Nitrosotalea sp.]
MPNFVNQQQKRFFMIIRAFKLGNILATVALALYAGKHFLGV